MKKLLCFSVITALVFLFIGCDQKPSIQPSGKTIKVGIIGPFTGPDLAKGKDGLKGIKAVLKMTPLLQNGDRIELVIEDDENNPDLTIKAMKKLVEVHNVSAVITFSSSGPVLALANIADTYQTPIISVLATHPAITENNDYISQICFDDRFQGSVAALYVRDELLLDRVAIFSNPDSIYSTNLATEFERKFSKIGGRVTDRVFMNGNAGSLFKTLKDVIYGEPELLYMPLDAKDVIRIIGHMKELSWNPKLMGSDGLLATAIIQQPEALPLLDGLLATDFFHSDMRLTRFGNRVKNYIEGKITSYGALGIEGFAILLNAMNDCHPAGGRACINLRIRATDKFKGVMGNIMIKPDGKAVRPLVINTIENGRMKYVVKVY